MGKEDPRYIVILTDGVWIDQSVAEESAEACKKEGIGIIALGFGDADEDFLKRIASSDSSALKVELSELGQTFSKTFSFSNMLVADGDTFQLDITEG